MTTHSDREKLVAHVAAHPEDGVAINELLDEFYEGWPVENLACDEVKPPWPSPQDDFSLSPMHHDLTIFLFRWHST